MVSRPVNVNDILDGQVSLDVECLDRIYLNLYVPNLQVSGQVVNFLSKHLGFPIPSSAVVEKIGVRFRQSVETFARSNNVPVVRFGKHDRKIEVTRPCLARQAATGRSGVAAIGAAQEFQNVFTASTHDCAGGGAPTFSWFKADRRVTCYYFYLWDEGFWPAFVKICAYFPYPGKVWLNGHEWAKRQASKLGVAFTALSNGFASCPEPDVLRAICDRLGPGTIGVFLERWWARLPRPLTSTGRTGTGGRPRCGRSRPPARWCSTARGPAGRSSRRWSPTREDLGRPDTIEFIFGRQVRSTTAGAFATRVVTRGVDVTINAFYKHSRIKQYFKEGGALRIGTVINSPTDLGVLRRLEHLDELQARAREVNRRLLDYERVGQGCVLASPAFERVAQPSLVDGQRAPALRFGDPRVMALAGALAIATNVVTGFTNRSLRGQVSALLGDLLGAAGRAHLALGGNGHFVQEDITPSLGGVGPDRE